MCICMYSRIPLNMKTRCAKYFDELCTDQRLTCSASLFRVPSIFYITLNILITFFEFF